jgi:hypothetical protein
MTMAGSTPWADKAASLYDEAYAARYRSHDEDLADSAAYRTFVSWLRAVCDRCTPPFDALDLGCGTGRYFCALHGIRTLVGLDASQRYWHTPGIRCTRIASPQPASRSCRATARLRRFGADRSIWSIRRRSPEHCRWGRPGRAGASIFEAGGRFAFSTVTPSRVGAANVPVVPAARGAALPAPPPAVSVGGWHAARQPPEAACGSRWRKGSRSVARARH